MNLRTPRVISGSQAALAAFAFALIFSVPAGAAEVAGQWQTEFDTQIGRQKYVFELKTNEGKVTGKARSDIGGVKRETELKEGKLVGDEISFVETLDFQGNALRITYKGKIMGDEIKFNRQVGEVANEEFTAKRLAAAEAKTDGVAAPAASATPRRARPPIELGLDDKAAFPAAPAGFDKRRADIPQGKIGAITYDSKTVGPQRQMVIYTPPDYSPAWKYPVLYLLHGIGDDQLSWWKSSHADAILDNLDADKNITPMIVVMPNGRADKNMTQRTPWNEQGPAFEAFEKELFGDVIPYVETHYSVKADREHRALAGLSMGGGQTLNIGLKHLEAFAWIGAFSSAPNTKPPAELVPAPEETARELKLLLITCGDKDGLFEVSRGFHTYLKEKNVPHIWHVDSGGHTRDVWSNDLYLFAPLLFH